MWRDEARELQRKQNLHVCIDRAGSLNYQRTEVTAPFATDSTANIAKDLSSELDRLKVCSLSDDYTSVCMCNRDDYYVP